ncbi:Rho GTPase-activating protein REN1-like protein [Drosera capensis]
MVIGRPILLALEEIDGSPSFLEKALRFIEAQGVKVEGILRQAADVEEVKRRVHEYEQGKTEFSPAEDAHVIADCVKHVLRELPSPPVPASCCNALLEALRTECNNRVNAMRIAILETFPEPNRRFLQRILRMMQTVASHKSDNRMSTSAVAACMSPLLLRPLLAGDCEAKKQPLDVAGDGSFQLLQAAAAANHAQAIIIILLDEYDYIFGEGAGSLESFSDSEESGTETEATDDDLYDDDDDDHEYGTEDHDGETDDEYDHSQSDRYSFVSKSPERDEHHELVRSTASSRSSTPRRDIRQGSETMVTSETTRDLSAETSKVNDSAAQCQKICPKSASTLYESGDGRRCRGWARSPAQKNFSMESIDFSLDEEEEIRKLEAAKNELQNRIAQEADGNALLQSNIEKRKKALHERRLALERDVARLQEQLQKERDLRASLEAGLGMGQGPASSDIDEKTNVELQEISIAAEDLNNLKQRFDDLETQLNQQREQNYYHQHDRNLLRQEGPARGAISINKQKDNESTAAVTSYHERSIRSKGTNTSALSKLTTRLNFLKERRNQIAAELQNLDKNREPIQSPQPSEKNKGSESHQLVETANRNQRQEPSMVHNRRDSGNQPFHDKMVATKGDGSQLEQEGGKKGSSPKSHNMFNLNFDRWRKPDVQQTQQADRVKSESQSSKNLDKGQRSEAQVSTSESQSFRSSDKALIRRSVF